MIEDSARTIYIEWGAKFLCDAPKIDILAMKFAVAIMERMHVVAALVSSAEAKITGAWHKRLYNCARRRANPTNEALGTSASTTARAAAPIQQTRSRRAEHRMCRRSRRRKASPTKRKEIGLRFRRAKRSPSR